MKIAYFYITEQGKALATTISQILTGDCYGKEQLDENLKMAMQRYDAIVCIMATGIVVRKIAPYIQHKTKDPAIVVLDQKGNYCISLLSGHLGGANQLAQMLAQITKGQAVITTATDVEGVLSFDVFAKEHDLLIENIGQLKYISSALLQGKSVHLYCDNESIKEELKKQIGVFEPQQGKEKITCAVVISPRNLQVEEEHVLYLRPKVVTIGIGCKKDRGEEGIEEALQTLLQKMNLNETSLKQVSTIPRKAQEEAVQSLRKNHSLELIIQSEESIKKLDLEALGIQRSTFVEKTVGISSVSTACAYLSSKKGHILVDKEKFTGFTLSLAIENGWETEGKRSILHACQRENSML